METARGLEVTTRTPGVIESIDHFHQQTVGMGPSADKILQAVATYPENLLLNTYTAAFYNYAQDDQAQLMAQKYIHQAEQLLKNANLRERLIYQGVLAWNRKDYECALTQFTSITQLYQRDTLAAKFAEWLFYCAGQYYNAHRYLALCENMASKNQDESHFLAMHAFALELSGHLHDAKKMADKAINKELYTPWAHHALAHVYLLSNDIPHGINALEALRTTWDSAMPLLKGHNLWHLALFYLCNRDEQHIMQIYPEIFGPFQEVTAEQIDAIALLWRMDMAGMPQPKAIKAVAKKLHHHPFEQYTGFNSAHFSYCLARAGEDAKVKHLLQAIEQYAKSLTQGYNQRLWFKVILPLCKAIDAFVKEDFKQAYKLLTPILEDCFQIGGSDAQDELITQMYLLCLLHLHKHQEAETFFRRYLADYKDTALAQYWFARVH